MSPHSFIVCFIAYSCITYASSTEGDEPCSVAIKETVEEKCSDFQWPVDAQFSPEVIETKCRQLIDQIKCYETSLAVLCTIDELTNVVIEGYKVKMDSKRNIYSQYCLPSQDGDNGQCIKTIEEFGKCRPSFEKYNVHVEQRDMDKSCKSYEEVVNCLKPVQELIKKCNKSKMVDVVKSSIDKLKNGGKNLQCSPNDGNNEGDRIGHSISLAAVTCLCHIFIYFT